MSRPARATVLRFDVHGRFQLDVVRAARAWVVYRVADGRRRLALDIAIPPTLEPGAVGGYLDDLLHELARPGTSIERRTVVSRRGSTPPGRGTGGAGTSAAVRRRTRSR